MPIKPEPDLLAGPFGRRGSLGPKTMSLQTEGKPPPPKGPSGLRIEDRIGIQAPPEVIWEVVYDLSTLARVEPDLPARRGEVRIGNVLDLDLVLPGQSQQELNARVLDWVPNEQLHWELRLLGGLIKTLRYIEISPLAETGCVVDNGEIFGGLMGPSSASACAAPVRARLPGHERGAEGARRERSGRPGSASPGGRPGALAGGHGADAAGDAQSDHPSCLLPRRLPGTWAGGVRRRHRAGLPLSRDVRPPPGVGTRRWPSPARCCSSTPAKVTGSAIR